MHLDFATIGRQTFTFTLSPTLKLLFVPRAPEDITHPASDRSMLIPKLK
jgi:hypothetical protein